MHYYLLPQNGWSRLVFPDQSEALGGATAPIASSVGRSEAPKALSESHRSLLQENPAAVRVFLGDFRGFIENLIIHQKLIISDYSSEYAHSVFYGLSNKLFL